MAHTGFHGQVSALFPAMKPVRVVGFNKTQDSNWGVPWHQDRIIAVQDRDMAPGYVNWSCKRGVWHCEPPLDVLENMLFVRLHLDDNTDKTGAMEIALESHKVGAIPASEADSQAQRFDTEVTQGSAGDALLLSIMTLHRSRPTTSPQQRRVLRIDYAAIDLPDPLKWAQ
ncbi:phytanoyl-CoA dioxygenase family protein [Shimia sp. Alg240-R146]|uniref:phytanoyl-CoA dioxygenase family protein n=1 Tax=Shimia sp. Alg240-R146 TaxID=2993449 RepID=UPI0022E0E2FF|nr:phytanoyl-CoA dioxygenase family protein [Shimia sp. Alg240-R146]